MSRRTSSAKFFDMKILPVSLTRSRFCEGIAQTWSMESRFYEPQGGGGSPQPDRFQAVGTPVCLGRNRRLPSDQVSRYSQEQRSRRATRSIGLHVDGRIRVHIQADRLQRHVKIVAGAGVGVGVGERNEQLHVVAFTGVVDEGLDFGSRRSHVHLHAQVSTTRCRPAGTVIPGDPVSPKGAPGNPGMTVVALVVFFVGIASPDWFRPSTTPENKPGVLLGAPAKGLRSLIAPTQRFRVGLELFQPP